MRRLALVCLTLCGGVASAETGPDRISFRVDFPLCILKAASEGPETYSAVMICVVESETEDEIRCTMASVSNPDAEHETKRYSHRRSFNGHEILQSDVDFSYVTFDLENSLASYIRAGSSRGVPVYDVCTGGRMSPLAPDDGPDASKAAPEGPGARPPPRPAIPGERSL